MWTDPAKQYVHSNDWRDGGCGDTPAVSVDPAHGKKEGCQYNWYTNWTFIPVGQKPTIPVDSVLRTWTNGGCRDPRDGGEFSEEACRTHPWAAPGTAPTQSPCGIDGGNPAGCPAGNPGKGGCVIGGYGRGPDAREWYQSRPRPVTEWAAGEEVEITWGISANHGGGYSFRLCPKPERLVDLTEECFQKGSLEFAGNTSAAIFDLGGLEERTEFPALGVSLPTGHWRQNPSPACGGSGGGVSPLACPKPYQFPPRVNRSNGDPMAGFHGDLPFGTLHKWAVVDRVKVPSGLAAGDYVMSHRFDSEQTAQVWNMCADIKVVKSVGV